MKLILSKGVRWQCIAIIMISALALISVSAAGYLSGCKYIRGITAMAEVNQYEMRSKLLMQAMDYVGACEPQKTVNVWAEGLIKRSAAMQYAVMSEKLKKEYAQRLEKKAPNWVTGISSPWVNDYAVVKTQNPDSDTYLFELRVFTMTSTGPDGEYKTTLTVAREGDFWRITGISADQGLDAYMGL